MTTVTTFWFNVFNSTHTQTTTTTIELWVIHKQLNSCTNHLKICIIWHYPHLELWNCSCQSTGFSQNVQTANVAGAGDGHDPATGTMWGISQTVPILYHTTKLKMNEKKNLNQNKLLAHRPRRRPHYCNNHPHTQIYTRTYAYRGSTHKKLPLPGPLSAPGGKNRTTGGQTLGGRTNSGRSV